MIFWSRIVLLSFFSAVLVTQFQNCSSYSENTMFQNTTSSSTAASDPSQVTFSVKNIQNDLFVGAYDDQLQIGGNCNAGGHLQNYFEYQLIPSNASAVVVNPNGNTDANKRSLTDSRCENGRFYLVLPVYCPNLGGPNIAALDSSTLKIYFHTYDSIDSNGQPVNYKRIDQSVFISLMPALGCP